MHKRLHNSARLGVAFRPRGPLLIKSGIETPDPTRPSMEFVRTRHSTLGETVYLPGTSLKGAIRSHAERVLSGLKVHVCNPFDEKSHCREIRRETSSSDVFARQCASCRTFGSLKVSGRVSFLDAYPWPPEDDGTKQSETFLRTNATESRWQVGIDRGTGGTVKGALFDLEIVSGGMLYSEVHLRNFQLWQLGIVVAALREMDAGWLAIGFGKARGLGQVAVDLGELELHMARRGADRLLGVAELSEEDRGPYDLHAEDSVAVTPDQLLTTWHGTRLTVDGDDRDLLLTQIIDGPLASFVTAWGDRPTVGGRR